jgi:hypothetical protein
VAATAERLRVPAARRLTQIAKNAILPQSISPGCKAKSCEQGFIAREVSDAS